MDLVAVSQSFPAYRTSTFLTWPLNDIGNNAAQLRSYFFACTASPRSWLFSRTSSVTHVLYFGRETSRTFRNNFFSTKWKIFLEMFFFQKYLRNILVSFQQFKQTIFYAKKIFWLCRKRSRWGNNSAAQLWEPCSSALVVILDLNV